MACATSNALDVSGLSEDDLTCCFPQADTNASSTERKPKRSFVRKGASYLYGFNHCITVALQVRKRAEALLRTWFLLREGLIGAEDDVGADGGGVIVGKILVKGNHAGSFELALQDDFKPLIVVECAGVAEVG